jgi:hypothetical protein
MALGPGLLLRGSQFLNGSGWLKRTDRPFAPLYGYMPIEKRVPPAIDHGAPILRPFHPATVELRLPWRIVTTPIRAAAAGS